MSLTVVKEQFHPIKFPTSSECRSRSVTFPLPPLPVWFSTCPCHSLSVGILLCIPIFPPTHLKSSRFYLGKGEPLCLRIFRVHPWILQLLATNLSLSGVHLCEVGKGGVDPAAIDVFVCRHQAQTTCWDHPKMTELYQTLGKNAGFLYRVDIQLPLFCKNKMESHSTSRWGWK